MKEPIGALKSIALMEECKIADLPDDLDFVCDSQNMDWLKMELTEVDELKPSDFMEYNAFYKSDDGRGNFYEVWGIYGVIPWCDKKAYLIYSE